MSEERGVGLDPADADDLDILDDLLGEEPDDVELPPDEELPAEPTEVEPTERRQPSRRQRAMDAMRVRLRREEEERRRLQADYERLLTQQRQPAAPPVDPYRQAEQDRLELERVAQMMPHEQAAHYSRKSEERIAQTLLRSQVQTADMLDRQAYQALCRDEPAAQRYADQVETMLATARNQGMNFSREALYNQIIATEIRARSKKQGEKQRAQGRRQIAAQTTTPGGSRSTAATPRRRGDDDSEAALDARLRSVTIGEVW